MKNLFLLAIVTLFLASSLTACKSASGSREFIPGKGWVPVK